MEVLKGLRNLDLTEGKYHDSKALIACNYSKVVHLVKSFHVTSVNNLAGISEAQGNYREAELLHMRSLEIRKKKFGEDHPDIATSLNNLAFLYYSQGNYREAEPLYVRSLKIRERQLGLDHLDVAATLLNLAALYNTTESYLEAMEVIQRAVQIYEHTLGNEHSDTQVALSWFYLISTNINNSCYADRKGRNLNGIK